jgi:hypothetical protein
VCQAGAFHCNVFASGRPNAGKSRQRRPASSSRQLFCWSQVLLDAKLAGPACQVGETSRRNPCRRVDRPDVALSSARGHARPELVGVFGQLGSIVR